MKGSVLIPVLVSLGLVGCQSTEKTPPVEHPKQFVDLTNGKGSTSDYWIIDKEHAKQNPGAFPKKLVRESRNGCAELTFAINSEGRVTGYRIEHSYPDDYVAESAAEHLATTRWLPAETNTERHAVLTNMLLEFTIPSVSEAKHQFREECIDHRKKKQEKVVTEATEEAS